MGVGIKIATKMPKKSPFPEKRKAQRALKNKVEKQKPSPPPMACGATHFNKPPICDDPRLPVFRLGARLKIDVLRTDSSREAPIWGYPVQCASANDGTAPMVGILGSILFPLPTFF